MSRGAIETAVDVDATIALLPLGAGVDSSIRAARPSSNYAACRRRELLDRHWTMLAVAIFIIAASFLLSIRGTSEVVLPWPHVKLPEMCGSRAFFGIECPGCGLTRSFIALASGDVAASFHFHRLGWLLALAVVVQIPYRIYALRELRSGIVARRWPAWFGNALIAALIVNWLVKIAGV